MYCKCSNRQHAATHNFAMPTSVCMYILMPKWIIYVIRMYIFIYKEE